MALQPNGTICVLGRALANVLPLQKENVLRIDYEEYSMVQKIILSNAKTVRSHSRLDGLTFCDCI
jgi:hypothetical protein